MVKDADLPRADVLATKLGVVFDRPPDGKIRVSFPDIKKPSDRALDLHRGSFVGDTIAA